MTVRRTLAAVNAAGRDAEEAMAAIAAPPKPGAGPGAGGWPLVGKLAGLVSGAGARPAPADQVRRTCEALDRFAEELAEAATVEATSEPATDRNRARASALTDMAGAAGRWSSRLWSDDAEAGPVYNEVRAAMVELERWRTRIILGPRSDDRG